MPGLSPKLPLSIDEVDGFATTKNFQQVARQNLKMIVLTNPGERVMIPGFGVGLRTYIFENASNSLFETIRQNIRQQVALYAPYVSIKFRMDLASFGNVDYDKDYSSIDVYLWS